MKAGTARRGLGEGWPLLALLPIAAILVAFEILPAIDLLLGSLHAPGGGLSLARYGEIVSSPFYRVSIRNSLMLSATSSAFGLVLGALGAYALSRSRERLQQAMIAFISMCINFAGVPLAFAFIILLGQSGLVTALLGELFGIRLYDYFSLYSWFGLGIVYTYFQVPLAILLLFPAFLGIRREWEEAATTLGAGPMRFWWSIGVPVLLPSLVSTASILFANAMGAYATAYALTTGILNILPLRITRLVAGEVRYDPALASAAAVVLGLITVGTLLAGQALARALRRGMPA